MDAVKEDMEVVGFAVATPEKGQAKRKRRQLFLPKQHRINNPLT